MAGGSRGEEVWRDLKGKGIIPLLGGWGSIPQGLGSILEMPGREGQGVLKPSPVPSLRL